MAQDPGLLKLRNFMVDAKYDQKFVPDFSSTPLNSLESNMISMLLTALLTLAMRRELWGI
jgi:hypothetical protein